MEEQTKAREDSAEITAQPKGLEPSSSEEGKRETSLRDRRCLRAQVTHASEPLEHHAGDPASNLRVAMIQRVPSII